MKELIPMTEFIRARSDQQKELRMQAILQAAGGQFDDMDFAAVTMKTLAEVAGLKKASLYNYFSTKEEVFMQLFIQELAIWIQAFRERSGMLAGPDRASVAGLITDLMLEHPRFTRLFAILSSVLERNVSPEKLRVFKTEVLVHGQEIAEIMQGLLPDLSPGRAFEFQIHLHAMVSGLWPLAHPNDALAEALEAEHLQVYRIDFASVCQAGILRLLKD